MSSVSTVPATPADEVDDTIPFKPGSTMRPGDFQPHNFIDDTVYYKLDELKGQWNTLMKKIGDVVSGPSAFAGLALDEITVKIGFNAKGKLVFIAEAGMDAAFEVSFKKAAAVGD